MARRVNNGVIIENADIGFLNFSGRPDKYNKDGGKRSFCIFLEEDLAEKMLDEGWYIRTLPETDERPARYYIQVAVSFLYPPKIVMISGGRKTLLNETTINLLDFLSIDTVDLSLTPYNWNKGGRTGCKAYLKTMCVVIEEDNFESKYRNIPWSDDENIPF